MVFGGFQDYIFHTWSLHKRLGTYIERLDERDATHEVAYSRG